MELKEYRLEWCRLPYCNNDPRVIFVKAENKKDAQRIVQDYVERHYGIPKSDFSVSPEDARGFSRLAVIQEAEPVPTGHVTE